LCWGIHRLENYSKKEYTFYLCKGIREFMEEEMGISMTLKQSLLFSFTPEFWTLWRSTPMVVPLPHGTLNLTAEQIKALEDYRRWKLYKLSKIIIKGLKK